jgi:hypothetical protein
MRERTAVGEQRRPRWGPVSPTEWCRGAFACPVAPRLPRQLPMVVPTAFGARDWSLVMARYQEGIGVQTPWQIAR